MAPQVFPELVKTNTYRLTEEPVLDSSSSDDDFKPSSASEERSDLDVRFFPLERLFCVCVILVALLRWLAILHRAR